MFLFKAAQLTDGYNTRKQDRMVEEMRNLVEQLANGHMDTADAMTYIVSLLEHQEETGHWLVYPDWHAPSDVRVRYIDQPTYLAASFLMAFLVRYPIACTELSGFNAGLTRGLEASTGRNFPGAFGDEQDRYAVMELFLRAGLREFMQIHADMCPSFSQMIRRILLETHVGIDSEWNRIAVGKSMTIQNIGKSPEYRGGVSFHALSASLLDRMTDMMTDLGIHTGTLVFVYGTLMNEGSNHESYLADSAFVGAGTLHGYALYDLGSYPGIKPIENDMVKGELFLVNPSTLKRLDSLEGEGHLYDRVTVEVRGSAVDSWVAQTYVYRGEVRSERKVKMENQPWKKDYAMPEAKLNATSRKNNEMFVDINAN